MQIYWPAQYVGYTIAEKLSVLSTALRTGVRPQGLGYLSPADLKNEQDRLLDSLLAQRAVEGQRVKLPWNTIR